MAGSRCMVSLRMFLQQNRNMRFFREELEFHWNSADRERAIFKILAYLRTLNTVKDECPITSLLMDRRYQEAEQLQRHRSPGEVFRLLSSFEPATQRFMANPEAVRIFDSHLDVALNHIDVLFYTILLRAQYPHSQRFEQFLMTRFQDLQRTIWKYEGVSWLYLAVRLVLGNCRYLCSPLPRCGSTIDRSQTLIFCIQMGLTTNEPFVNDLPKPITFELCRNSPFALCVEENSYPEVVLLYQTGAVSNTELFHVAENEQQISVRPQTQTADFVVTVAAELRTLQNLCCLRISYLLGTGQDRKKRAEKSGLPPVLVNAVLFKDALSQYEEAIDPSKKSKSLFSADR